MPIKLPSSTAIPPGTGMKFDRYPIWYAKTKGGQGRRVAGRAEAREQHRDVEPQVADRTDGAPVGTEHGT